MKGRRAKEQTGGGSFRSELVPNIRIGKQCDESDDHNTIWSCNHSLYKKRRAHRYAHTHTTGTETLVKGFVPKSKEVQSALFSV